MGKCSVLGDAAQVTRCFHYCCKLHSISQACNKSICFSILPLTWGSQSVLCVWWLWVSNCRSAPPHCSLVDKNTYVTRCNNMSQNRKAHAWVFATLTLSERHDVPHLSVLAQQNGQLLDSAVLFSASKTIFGLFKCHVILGPFIFWSNKEVAHNFLPSPRLMPTKTPCPPSASGIPGLTKRKEAKKAGIQTGSRLMSREFKPWWEPVMQRLAMDMAAMLIWINRQN